MMAGVIQSPFLRNASEADVAGCAVWNDIEGAVDPGARHIQRAEDALVQELSPRFAAHFLDDHTEQVVSRIAIAPRRAAPGTNLSGRPAAHPMISSELLAFWANATISLPEPWSLTKFGMPDVWVSRCRTVTPLHACGNPLR